MRTQDLQHFENLAKAMARGIEPDPAEIEYVLEATQRSRQELDRRAQFHRGWVDQQVKIASEGIESELEDYQEKTKIMGAHEGLVIVVAPLVLMVVLGGLSLLLVYFSQP